MSASKVKKTMTLRITLLSLLSMALAMGTSAQTVLPFTERQRAILDSLTAEGDTLLMQVAQNKATTFDYYFNEAMRQRQKGNQTAVFELLKYCLQLDSTSAAAHFYLSQCYLQLKDKQQSAHHLNRAAELSPHNTIYLETLARTQVSTQDYAAATKTVERLVAEETDRTDMLELLFQLYEQQGDHANAIKTIERLELLSGKNEQLSYRKSKIYTEMGNDEAAIAEMKLLADEHPNDPAYRCIYADALLDGGRDAEGLAIVNDILQSDSMNMRALVTLYDYHSQRGDRQNTETVARKLLLTDGIGDDTKISLIRDMVAKNEQEGGDSTKILNIFEMIMEQPEVSADLALFYASYMEYKNMPREGINAVLERVLDIAPDNVSARFNLVAHAWNKNDMSTVIDLCADARRYNSDQLLFYYYQGLAYYRIGNKDNALDAFRNGISTINEKSEIDIVSDFYALMGDLLHDKGEYAAAYAAYDSCLQWKPDNIGCLNNYAYFLSLDESDLDKAERMSHKTIQAQPDNATYLDTYAWILFLQKRYDEAKVYINQAVSKDKDESETILEHAGDIHAMSGDIDAAVNLWKQALVKDRNNKLLIKKIQKKKYLKR